MPVDKKSADYVDEILSELKKDSRFKGIKIHPSDVKEILDSFNKEVSNSLKKRMIVDLKNFLLFPFPRNKSRMKYLIDRKSV